MATKKELKKKLKAIRNDAKDSIKMVENMELVNESKQMEYWYGLKAQAEITLGFLDGELW